MKHNLATHPLLSCDKCEYEASTASEMDSHNLKFHPLLSITSENTDETPVLYEDITMSSSDTETKELYQCEKCEY